MISEKAEDLIFELERYAEISQSNNPNPKRIATRKTLQDHIATLEAENAALKDRISAYETGFDPKANKPKEISDLEDEIVVFKDKMGRPYIGVFDTVINKWRCIAETKSIFSTDAIERWFPLPGRRGE